MKSGATILLVILAVIMVGGCSGTLSEIALAWQMGRPIASIADSGGWSQKLAGHTIDNRRTDQVFPAASARDAIGSCVGQ